MDIGASPQPIRTAQGQFPANDLQHGELQIVDVACSQIRKQIHEAESSAVKSGIPYNSKLDLR
jgi:hypothetical protein